MAQRERAPDEPILSTHHHVGALDIGRRRDAAFYIGLRSLRLRCGRHIR
jgi:hypothetical protein